MNSPRGDIGVDVSAFLALAGACAALALRSPSGWAVAVTAAAGVAGLAGPVGTRPDAGRVRVASGGASLRTAGAVGAIGMAGFALVRLGAGPVPGPRATMIAVAAACLAAVAEEALFRRFAYGRLEHLGAGIAIAVTAMAFAAIHVPLHGAGVLGLDFAAGLVFGWQRWVTGTWAVPAATHVFANLVQMG